MNNVALPLLTASKNAGNRRMLTNTGSLTNM